MELASAWITLAISAENMQRDMRRELNKLDDGTAKTVGSRIGKDLETAVGKSGKQAGLTFAQEFRTPAEKVGATVGLVLGKAIGTSLKVGIAGAAGAAALAVGGIGFALTKGFDRLKAVDDARFKLSALGNDAATVAKIMDSALASVQGTAFSLDQAAGTAASAVAAGVKPGEQLTKYLKDVGDLAAVSQRPLDDVGAIFNKIQTTNKAYLEDLQQLPDIPIFQWLQQEYGVTADKLSDMVSKGEVDAQHFQDAIEDHIGGAAQKMGQSFSGAVDNMETSVARLGANFITAILGGDPTDALAGPTQAIGILTQKFDDIGVWVNAHRGEIHQFFADVGSDVRILAGYLGDVTGFLVQHPALIETIGGLYATWKITSFVGDMVTLSTTLGLLPGLSTAAAAGIGEIALAGGPLIAIAAALAYVIANGDYKPNPVTMTSGPGPERPQLPGVNLGGPGATTPTIAAGPSIPSDMPLPKGFHLDANGNITKDGHATGGAIFGAGGPKSDSIPIWASNGEHVWTAAEVAQAGGQQAVYRLRAMARAGMFKGFATGGAITIDALKQFASGISGHGYKWGGGNGDTFDTDCSGAQSTIANFITGGQGRFSTGDEATALLARGFHQGDPPEGVTAYWVGWMNGGPGGGHTAGTIVDPKGGNVNVAMGGSSGGGAYGSSAGASSFPNRAWIAVAGGDDPSKSNFASASGGGSSSGGSLGTSSGGGGGQDASSLGQSVISGMLQSLGLDGSVFSDPLDWPNFKSAMALANFGGSLLKNVIGSDGADLLKPIGPGTVTPRPDETHFGTGAAPGPLVAYNGTVNMGVDPRAMTQRQSADMNQAWRKSGMSAVKPG